MIDFSGHASNRGNGIFRFHSVYRLFSHLPNMNRVLGIITVLIGLAFSTNSYALTISGTSQEASLDCTSSPCPWGDTLTRQGVVWPATMNTVSNRLGYTTSHPIYLSAADANGAVVTIFSGTASLRKGGPNASTHSTFAVLSNGESYAVSGLASHEVLLISDLSSFTYEVTWPEEPTDPGPTDPPTDPDPTTGLSSQFVTLNCTSSPCPWGPAPGSNAIVWPATAATVTNRLGYTATDNVYLQYDYANGSTITVNSGSANLNAGYPDDTTFRSLGSVNAGESITVSGLVEGEVLVVSNSTASFTYDATVTEPTPPDPASGPEHTSRLATLTCDGTNCPAGPSTSTNAIVWPVSAKPVYHRLDYVSDRAIYLPRAYADGAKISIVSGSASVRAGHGNATEFRLLRALNAGETFVVSSANLASGEVISVTSGSQFTFTAELSATPPAPVGDEYSTVPTFWRCNTEGCTAADWDAHSVPWQDWSAYSYNGRTGTNGRTTYDEAGGLIYPYMGNWADGCVVSVVSGIAVVIDEWEHGTDTWSQTAIGPGETHTVRAPGPNDAALFESWGPFTVAVTNCTPQILQ